MTLKQWMRNVFGQRVQASGRACRGRPRQPWRARFVPMLDLLEDRLTPTVNFITVTGGAALGDATATNLSGTGPNYTAANLRSAVIGADKLGGTSDIVFAPGLFSNPQTIGLNIVGDTSAGNSALQINNNANITIVGPSGNNGLTLVAAPTNLEVPGDPPTQMRFFDVTFGATLTLQYLTLRGGDAMGFEGGTPDAAGAGGGSGGLGGAIFNQGTLTIENSTLTGNSAQGGAGGSYLSDTVLVPVYGAGGAGLGAGGGNFGYPLGSANGRGANGGGYGGGPNGGGLSGHNGPGGMGGFGGGGGGGSGGANAQPGVGGAGGFGGGGGGAAGANGGHFTSTGGAGGFGGGGGGGENSVYGDPGAGGVGGYGGGNGASGNGVSPTAGSLRHAYVVGGGGGGAGMGGAVFNEAGTVTITNSTFYDNTAQGGAAGSGSQTNSGTAGKGLGGGLFNHNGIVTVTNSTFSDNTAAQGGRDVFNLSDGAGKQGIANINNSILGQSGSTAIPDFDSVNNPNNLGIAPSNNGSKDLMSNFGTFAGGVIVPNPALGPLLGPLQDNGGPTPTMALLPGSPAINAGSNALAVDPFGRPLTTDQRGLLRIFPALVDIGAYELQAFNMVVNTAAAESTAASTLSLRQALDLATGLLPFNALSGAEEAQITPVAGNASTITFASSLIGSTLTLSAVGDDSLGSSAFLISSDVVIDGATGNGAVTLSAAGTAMRLFNVTSTGNLTLENLTLSGGAAQGFAGGAGDAGGGGGAGLGGAILNQGTLTILDSTLSGNTVTGGAGGSGGQSGHGGGGGAGLSAVGGAASGTGGGGGGPNGGGAGQPGQSGKNGYNGGNGGYGGGGGGGGVMGFANGKGGAGGYAGFGGGGGGGGGNYYGYGGAGGFGGGGGGASSAQLFGGHGGGAGGYGGGSGGQSALHGQGAGGGGAGLGGALFNQGGAVTITNSTFSGNVASGGAAGGAGATPGAGLGGAVFTKGGVVTLSNTTLSGNSATIGAALFNYSGAITVANATVSGNSASTNGGGLVNFSGTTKLTNTIVAGNTATSGPDVAGSFSSQGYNLIGKTDGSAANSWIHSGASADLLGTVAAPLDPQLDPLSYYGGPTQTMALQPGSPAIGAGTSLGAPATDQRGFHRNGAMDIGAFQTGVPLVVSSVGDGLSAAGTLDLRAAVNLANVQPGADAITFDQTVFGTPQTITLSAGPLTLTDSATTTITGLGAALVTVNGNHKSAVFQINGGASAALSGMAVTAGAGGGVTNSGTATLTDCTLTGNSASFGGGLFNFSPGTVTLTDCTISGNSASANGGGMYNSGTATLTNCTVSGNSASGAGGGLFNFNSSGFTLLNTIIAGNTAPASPDVRGTFSSQGFNLIGNISGSSGWIMTGPSADLTNTNPLLGPLGYYGGLTLTVPLRAGSPAIDHGASVGAPATDERGFGRVGPVDIGAYEFQTPIPLVVNTSTDVALAALGKLDLRTAIDLANIQTGADTITFDPTVFSTPKTITLTFGPLTLTDSATTTITGPGADLLTVSGNHASGVIQIAAHASAALSGLTITAGLAASGGGVDNSGTATLSDCTISGNSASGSGGGVYNSGTATLSDCTISGNSAILGGGLYNLYSATLSGCTISGNSATAGGGLVNLYSAALSNCTVSGNFASFNGGGVYNAGTATLMNCTISGNSATSNSGGGGGLFNTGGTATLTYCTISGNAASFDGGGLYNKFTGGTVNLYDSTISGNAAQFSGGGVYSSGTAELINCTISGNAASGGGGGSDGGGMFNFGTATLINCTVSGNAAPLYGGVFNAGSATLLNTIIAGNTGAGGPDVFGTFLSKGFNLIGNTSDSAGWIGTGSSADLTDINPMLGQLGYYGGPTQTIPLLPGSPALNAGTSAGAPATDQRGFGRIGFVDIGAFEAQLPGILVIETTADGAFGTLDLRGAADLANIQTGIDTIVFDPTVFSTPQTITLTHGVITLTDTFTTTIKGPAAGLTVSGNHASGVFQITTGASAALSDLTISAGSATSGGGVDNLGTVTLTDCTLSGNSASFGGGVYNAGSATLINCTLSGNSASSGGALYDTGTARLTNCTVSGNSAAGTGGGVFHSSHGSFSLLNTIVAGNTGVAPDAAGTFVSQGNNLIGKADGSSGWVGSDRTGTILNPLDPLLAPLGNYGGPTETMALLSGSPAINAGNNSVVGTPLSLTTDQRGLSRLVGSSVDIGAFELQAGEVFAVVTFSALTSPSITYGTSTTTLTGHIGSGTNYPTGSSISITLNSFTQTATVDGSGNFTSTFTTGSLDVAASPYLITYVFAGNASFVATTDSSTELTVTKAASVTTTVGAVPFTYTGSAQIGGSGTVTGAGGLSAGATSLTYSANADGSGTADEIDAGTYYVTAHYAGDANHLPSDGNSVAITIKQASSTTTTVGAGPFTFNGSAQVGGSGTVTGAGGLSTSATSVTYSANADGTGTADQIDAGAYYVTAHYAGDANHLPSDGSAVQITISKAASTTVTVGDGPFTYDGTAHVGGSGTVTGAGGLNTTATSLTYTGDQTDAGTYYVTAHYAGDGNHLASDGLPVAITIKQASSMTTTVGAGPFTYTGNAQVGGSGTVTGAGIITGSATVTYSANMDGSGTADQTDAGTYYVTAHYAGDANHQSSDGSPIAITIKQASSTTTTVGAGPYTYNGSAQVGGSGMVTGAGVITGSATVTYSANADGSGTADQTDAGTYYVTAHYAGDANHTASDGAAVEITINKATSMTSTVGAGPFTYTGSAQVGGSGTVTGAGGLSTSATSVTYSANADGSGTADQTDAGTYYVTAHYAGDANHLPSDGSAVEITISKATSTTTTVGAGPFTYTGSAQVGGSGIVTGAGVVTGSATVTYSANSDGTGTADQTDAGTYYVTAHYAGDANHLASDGAPVGITINKAVSTTTVSIGAGPFIFTGSGITPATVSVTGAGGLNLTPVANYANNVNPGVATASYNFAGDANHLPSSDSKTFTIIPAAPTVGSLTATSITSSIATLGGTVVAAGGATILKRGILYAPSSANATLTLGSPGVIEIDSSTAALGTFTQNLKGLSPSTQYSFVAFATNSQTAGYSNVSTFTTTIAGPATGITGPASGQPGQTLTFTLDAYEPNSTFQLYAHVFHIKWGDGTTATVTSLNDGTSTHAYATSGTYTIQVSATDAAGTTLPTATWTVTISGNATPGATTSGVTGIGKSANVLAVANSANRPTTGNSIAGSSVNPTSSIPTTVSSIDALLSASGSSGSANATSKPVASTLVLSSLTKQDGDALVDELFATSVVGSPSLMTNFS